MADEYAEIWSIIALEGVGDLIGTSRPGFVAVDDGRRVAFANAAARAILGDPSRGEPIALDGRLADRLARFAGRAAPGAETRELLRFLEADRPTLRNVTFLRPIESDDAVVVLLDAPRGAVSPAALAETAAADLAPLVTEGGLAALFDGEGEVLAVAGDVELADGLEDEISTVLAEADEVAVLDHEVEADGRRRRLTLVRFGDRPDARRLLRLGPAIEIAVMPVSPAAPVTTPETAIDPVSATEPAPPVESTPPAEPAEAVVAAIAEPVAIVDAEPTATDATAPAATTATETAPVRHAPEASVPPTSLPLAASAPAVALAARGEEAVESVEANLPEPKAVTPPAAAPSETPAEAPTAEASPETPVAEAAPTHAEPAEIETPAEGFRFVPLERPVKFVWQMDADHRFTLVSEELAAAVGPAAADLVGRRWNEVAERFGIDRDGTIAGALERRDTWSGRTLLWPVEGEALRVPVDLAALPAFGRGRIFVGFRGFGTCRPDAPIADPQATGRRLGAHGALAETSAPVAPVAPSAPLPVAAESSEPPLAEIAAPATAPAPTDAAVEAVVEAAATTTTVEAIAPVVASSDTPASVPTAAPAPAPSPAEEYLAEVERALAAPTTPKAPPVAPESPTPVEPAPVAGSTVAAVADLPAADAVADLPAPNEAGEPAVEASIAPVADTATTTPAEPEAPVVVPLAAAGRAPIDPSRLSTPERNAFRQIAEALGARIEGEAAPPVRASSSPSVEDAKPAAPRRRAADVAGPTIDARLLDRLPVAVALTREDRFLHANQRFLSLLRYPDLETLEAAGGVDALFAGPHVARRFESEAGRVVPLIARDGTVVPCDVNIASVPIEGGSALMLTLTERTIESPVAHDVAPAAAVPTAPAVPAGSDADREHIGELQAIVDTATDGVLMLDASGLVISANAAAEALFGVERRAMIGRPFTDRLAPESRRAATDYLDGLAANGVASVLNDGREVIGVVEPEGLIPLFMTVGRVSTGPVAKYCAVLRDITQWKKSEEELTSARRRAEEASIHKSDFLAKISHEIRTPLNAIIGFSELMMDERFGPIGNERYKDYLRDIHVSGSHIMSLVDDLLDLSKVEAGKMDLRFEAVVLSDIVSDCVALMQPQANRERIIIRSSLPAGVPPVVADQRSMRQVVLNLLSNAVKFTPAGGQVIVSIGLEDNGEVILRVRDTGYGMSEKELETALEPFRQLHTTRSRSGGTGLGLPLTKALSEANRAVFRIDSTVGQGTLVSVTFPVTRVLSS